MTKIDRGFGCRVETGGGETYNSVLHQTPSQLPEQLCSYYKKYKTSHIWQWVMLLLPEHIYVRPSRGHEKTEQCMMGYVTRESPSECMQT